MEDPQFDVTRKFVVAVSIIVFAASSKALWS
jgi:hypothetical protein